ncbi:MAG: response regulator transcription factor [Pseudomonadota bacterium]
MRLLLVEDSQRLQRAVSEGLTRERHAVDVASDGAEGLRLTQERSYDAIILDLMLPEGDGIAVLGALRERGCDAHVLVLTARDTLSDKLRAFATGADDFMVKPFAFEELVARLQALSRRRSGQKNPRIVVGALEIDTGIRQVRRAGEEVVLPAREYALLELLATRAGQVVSRRDIEERLYRGREEPTSNAIDAALYALRARLDCGGPSYIETRRGLGWVLRPPP